MNRGWASAALTLHAAFLPERSTDRDKTAGLDRLPTGACAPRTRMETPLCGPVPSPRWPRSTLLQLPDAVAEASCFFVGFLGDRLLELLAQLDQFGLGLLILGQSPRRLAAMLHLAVNVFQQRGKLLAKFLIIMGTTEPARIAKFDKLDPADRTLALVEEARFI